MTNIYTEIQCDFDTDRELTKEQFESFQKKLFNLKEEWTTMIYDAAHESGFEIDTMHPLMMDEVYSDLED